MSLIPIYDAVKQTRERREKDWSQIDNWHQTRYNTDYKNANTRRLLEWINEYTSGRFYIDPTLVGFKDEADFVIFKLWYKE